MHRLASILFCTAWLAAPAAAATWPQWGGAGPGNQRAAIGETAISPSTVAGLQTKWTFTAAGNIAATPTVANGAVFLTDDWGGVYRLDARTGAQIWMHWMSDYTGAVSSASRSSPALAGKLMILADRHSGAVVALDQATGSLVWKTVIETNPAVLLTASPVVHAGTVYVGTASNEEYRASVSASYTPSFRGSVAALSLADGHLQWQTHMVPPGYTGGAVWGSGFAVSPSRGLLYVATGNNYSLPPAVDQCVAAASTAAARQACLAANDYVDAVVALDLASGSVRWGRRLDGLDTFTLNCGNSQPAQPCPTPAGHDYDFGSAPNLLPITRNGVPTELVGAGQKSGFYWALNPANGALAWHAAPGPGGRRGGIMWGSAVDAGHVYITENNSSHAPYSLNPNGTTTIRGGSWAALDNATGAVLWRTAVPGQPTGAEGAMSVANGVVFGGTTGGTMAALDAATGQLLWQFQSGASVTCGPAIVDGVVYWGNGDPYGTPGKTLYAFALPG